MSVQARPFPVAWTLAHTAALAECACRRPKMDDSAFRSWCDEFADLRHGLARAVGEHLVHLFQQGQLERVDPMGRSVRWVVAWNAMLEEGDWPGHAVRALSPLQMAFMILISSSIKGSSVEQAHAAICSAVLAGKWDELDVDAVECSLTGVSVSATIDGWAVCLGERALRHGRHFHPFESVAPPPRFRHQVIPVPTGELWVADWFRIPAFTDAMSAISTSSIGPESINNLEGCARQTRRFAEEAGVAHVSVGGISPCLVATHGVLVGGYVAEDDEGALTGISSTTDALSASTPVSLGQTCSDLWWVSLADRQTVLELAASQVGLAAAKEQLDEFEASAPYGFNVLRVKPGTYHLYAAGSPEVFASTFAVDGLSLFPVSEPVFVLSPEPLTPAPVRRPRLGPAR